MVIKIMLCLKLINKIRGTMRKKKISLRKKGLVEGSQETGVHGKEVFHEQGC